MATVKQTAQKLWDDVVLDAACDNARATEGVRTTNTPEGCAAVRASAEMIIDSMASEREYRDYVAAPISARVQAELHGLLAREFPL